MEHTQLFETGIPVTFFFSFKLKGDLINNLKKERQ